MGHLQLHIGHNGRAVGITRHTGSVVPAVQVFMGVSRAVHRRYGSRAIDHRERQIADGGIARGHSRSKKRHGRRYYGVTMLGFSDTLSAGLSPCRVRTAAIFDKKPDATFSRGDTLIFTVGVTDIESLNVSPAQPLGCRLP